MKKHKISFYAMIIFTVQTRNKEENLILKEMTKESKNNRMAT